MNVSPARQTRCLASGLISGEIASLLVTYLPNHEVRFAPHYCSDLHRREFCDSLLSRAATSTKQLVNSQTARVDNHMSAALGRPRGDN